MQPYRGFRWRVNGEIVGFAARQGGAWGLDARAKDAVIEIIDWALDSVRAP